MRSRLYLGLAAAMALTLAAPAPANGTTAEPVLSHARLDQLENHIGWLGLLGLLGLFGLRRRDDRH